MLRYGIFLFLTATAVLLVPQSASAQWTGNGNDVYKNPITGNVGIGTNNPTTAKVVISGTAGAAGLDLATADQYAELRVIRNSLNAGDKDLYFQYSAGIGSKVH